MNRLGFVTLFHLPRYGRIFMQVESRVDLTQERYTERER